MKIDIHAHTKRCKSGDSSTREISPADFCETILGTEVRIIAITNHNTFDLNQYKEIEGRVGRDAQVWPGIEIDVAEADTAGHLLVIVSPRRAQEFSEAVNGLTEGLSPDRFTATIEQVLGEFDSLEPLYVAHYKQKTPSISNEGLEKLVSETKNPGRVIMEVTNSISAGIYISHGHVSIYGSDVHDWAEYEALSRDLPDLRLPLDSFEQFCLLLEKDLNTINTVLDKKTSEDLDLFPFDDGSCVKLRAFNDINVIFGPKGTGKSCILQAIAKHYSENGMDARVYESASDKLDEIFDIRGKGLAINLNNYGIDYCNNEIKSLRTVSEVDVTSLSSYADYFKAKSTNKNAKKILLKDIEPEEESDAKREFVGFYSAMKKTAEFLIFLSRDPSVGKELGAAELAGVIQMLSGLHKRLGVRSWTTFSGWKEIQFLNSAIRSFRSEVGRKTGTPAKPTTTGFREYAMNRVAIEVNAAKIVRSVETKIPMRVELIGSLGPNKGDLEVRTEFVFQSGTIRDGASYSLTDVKKAPQQKFISCIQQILSHAYSDELFQHISRLNSIEDVEDINTVHELLLFKKYFSLDGSRYSPSSGEAAMVMLQKELEDDKDVYILDEPERSLGNEYISDVIVPLIRNRARAGKKMFISTHDANIAVRTLPYCSVYRCHGPEGYSTYVGNPFSNKLVNSDDESDRLDWKKISMKTLEGGEDAFGERGKIYGNP